MCQVLGVTRLGEAQRTIHVYISIYSTHCMDGLNQCQCDSQLDITVRGSPHTALVETMHLK